MAEKDCTKCGRCCIVCSDIQLTREEVREELYPKRRRNKPHSDSMGWSKWIMLRGKIYEPQLKREIFACVYWDPMTRDCLIYEDRPTVCQEYECVDEISGRVHGIWREIKEKKEEALCLEA